MAGVLLQTAREKVGNPGGDVYCSVRILLDSCYQKSYISTRLRNELCLPSVGTETVLIKTFSNNEPSLKKCNIVHYYYTVVQNHVVRGELHGPVAIRSRLCYVLSGPVNVACSDHCLQVLICPM